MSNLLPGDEERAAFCQDITLNRTLDYFFVFDNVPLQFIFRDRLNPGEMSDLEERNKRITETVWLDAYHQELVCNIIYRYLYRGSMPQMPFELYQFGNHFVPAEEDTSRVYVTAEEFRAKVDASMQEEGWELVEQFRKQPPMSSWLNLVRMPDRTHRIVSLMPIGNQVVIEVICTWTEDGVLKETAWAAVLVYDVDGTVLQDRSYVDKANWPSENLARLEGRGATPPQALPDTRGVLDSYFAHNRSLQSGVHLSDLEKRNLSIIEDAWIDARNGGSTVVFHADRYRLQLPLWKCSCSLNVAMEIDALAREAAPDRRTRIGMVFAKGNQVVAEGIVAWTDDGALQESPFISFLLLDEQGLIIRERSYIDAAHWPGGGRIVAHLGCEYEYEPLG